MKVAVLDTCHLRSELPPQRGQFHGFKEFKDFQNVFEKHFYFLPTNQRIFLKLLATNLRHFVGMSVNATRFLTVWSAVLLHGCCVAHFANHLFANQGECWMARGRWGESSEEVERGRVREREREKETGLAHGWMGIYVLGRNLFGLLLQLGLELGL